jgi:hypothetical protein
MLELIKKTDGSISLKATLTHPIVYLDHWAVIEFSNQKELQRPFISLLKKKSGTLLLSQANFFEAAGFESYEQAERIEDFLEAVLPNIHIVDFSLDAAMFGEARYSQTKPAMTRFWIVEYLLELARENGGNLTFKTMYTAVIKEHSMLKPLFIEAKAEIAKAMHVAIHSNEMLRKAKNYKPDDKQPPANLVLSAYLHDAQKNNTQKFELNDSVDLIHAVPAVLTGDFALLDKKWCQRTDRAEKYLVANGVNLKIARRYWGKAEQIDKFFDDLKNYSHR